MPLVWIPSLYLDLTGGKEKIQIDGSTIREVLDNLEALYPGIKERLLNNGDVRADISVLVDGEVNIEGLRKKVSQKNEIFFVPAISGG